MERKIESTLIDNLGELSVLYGPSTRETDVQRWLFNRFSRCGVRLRGDAVGNLWTKPVEGRKLRCALVAHSDEIGIQITSVEEPGIARFRKIGGLRASSLAGHRIWFRNSQGEDVFGIIGCDPMQDNGTENGLLLKTSDLWVDIGAESKADFERRLAVGDFGVFCNRKLERLSDNRYVGKAIDDRCGLTVGVEVYEDFIKHGDSDKVKSIDLVFVSTVQEELNLFGAKALPLEMDVAIILDVDFCADTPSAVAESTNLALGGGIGLILSADSSPVLLDIAKKVSMERNIPVRVIVGRSFSGGTDAAALRLKNAVATINIGIPLRYMHTAREVVDVRDLVYAYEMATGIIHHLSLLSGKDDLIPWK